VAARWRRLPGMACWNGHGHSRFAAAGTCTHGGTYLSSASWLSTARTRWRGRRRQRGRADDACHYHLSGVYLSHGIVTPWRLLLDVAGARVRRKRRGRVAKATALEPLPGSRCLLLHIIFSGSILYSVTVADAAWAPLRAAPASSLFLPPLHTGVLTPQASPFGRAPRLFYCAGAAATTRAVVRAGGSLRLPRLRGAVVICASAAAHAAYLHSRSRHRGRRFLSPRMRSALRRSKRALIALWASSRCVRTRSGGMARGMATAERRDGE